MKKFYVLILSMILFCGAVSAEKIQYKNINDGERITFSDLGQWKFADKKTDNYFVKKISDGTGAYSEFYTPQNEFVFSTGCQYEFLYNGSLIGYSNFDLKFYEFVLNNELLEQRELSENEVKELFKNFDIIRVSDFTTSTNSLRIKKTKRHYKIILLNDTDRYFYHYGFTSNNAKFETYPVKGFLDITKKGMIQFSHFGDNTKENPWFILLVR